MALPNTATDSKDFLLGTQSVGDRGPLFPMKHEDAIGNLVIGLERPEPDRTILALRTIGMRIDPCFKMSAALNEPCTPMLRLVWQPTAGLGSSKVRTFDAAVHTFYSLSRSEFDELKKQLWEIKTKNSAAGVSTYRKPLEIHPAYSSPRRNAFQAELKRTILKFAGEKNLIRFTFMRVDTPKIWWDFGGQDRQPDGKWAAIQIPRIQKTQIDDPTRQDFFNEELVLDIGMKGVVRPEPTTKNDQDQLSRLVTGWGFEGDTKKDAAYVRKKWIDMNRIENPRIHNPATMDCVHCHITDPTRLWLEKEHPTLVKLAKTQEQAYVENLFFRHNLKNTTLRKDFNKSLRAFGYFDTLPSLNQRAINESAAVADEMSSYFIR